jgi:Rieske Fe-S protein
MAAKQTKSGNSADLGRRGFLDTFLGGSLVALAAAVVYPVLRFVSPPRIPEAAGKQVLAGTVPELAKDGWKIFPFGQEAAIVVQTGPEEYRAFSAMCTHLDCTVQFDKPSERIWCACHNGWYDLTGRNVEGPPPRPLTVFDVRVIGEDIFVTRA